MGESSSFIRTESKLPTKGQIFPQKFNIDEYSNFQADFITTAATLRARVYSIDEIPRYKVVRFAGEIIPISVPCVSSAVGATGFEFLKYSTVKISTKK